MYGQQEDIAKVFDFGSTNKNEMKCKLYGYDSEADCDLSIFKVRFRSTSGHIRYKAGLMQFLAGATLLPSWCLSSTEMGCWY